MEARLRSVEEAIFELRNDFRLLNQTLMTISETLKELKENNTKLHNIEKHLITEDGDIASLKNQAKVLFKFKDDTEERMRALERSDTVKSVKIGGAETIYLILITAVIGVAVTLFKG